MKQLEIIEHDGTTKIKSKTEELMKDDAALMLLNAYIGICEEYDISPIELLVNGLRSAQDEENETKPDPEECEYWDDWEDDYDCCDICGQYYSDCDCD